MSENFSPPLKPIPMKDRISMIFIQYSQIDVVFSMRYEYLMFGRQ